MKIIIVGLGKTGMLLAENLSKENHDVTVIDRSKSKVEAATDKFSVSGICGSGASQSILMKAGADTADVIAALMPMDEANLMTCLNAKKLGTRYAAVRLESPEFADDTKYITEQFGIDYIVNPKKATAYAINRQIGLPGNVKADAFFASNVVMLRIELEKGSILANKPLKDVRSVFDTDMLIGAVRRSDKMFIPKGDFVLEEGDVINIVSSQSSTERIITALGLLRKPVKNVFIVGGGITGGYLTAELIKDGKNVTILDYSKERCMELSEVFPKANIAYASEIDSETLTEEGIEKADVFVSLTNEDERNLVFSLFAWGSGIGSIITRVSDPSYEKLLDKVKIDITVSPTVTSSDMLMRFIRNVTVFNEKGNDIRRIYSIAGGLAEAIEFIAYDDCKKLGIPLKSPDFKLKKGILVAAVIRGDEVIIAGGNTVIESGDNVIVIAKSGHGLNILNDIFA